MEEEAAEVWGSTGQLDSITCHPRAELRNLDHNLCIHDFFMQRVPPQQTVLQPSLFPLQADWLPHNGPSNSIALPTTGPLCSKCQALLPAKSPSTKRSNAFVKFVTLQISLLADLSTAVLTFFCRYLASRGQPDNSFTFTRTSRARSRTRAAPSFGFRDSRGRFCGKTKKEARRCSSDEPLCDIQASESGSLGFAFHGNDFGSGVSGRRADRS